MTKKIRQVGSRGIALFPNKLPQGKKSHDKLCRVCKHKKRAEIELLYMQGLSPYSIPLILGIFKKETKAYTAFISSIYNHVYAYGANEVRVDAVDRYLEKTIDASASYYADSGLMVSDTVFASLLKLSLQKDGKLETKLNIKTDDRDVEERVKDATERATRNLRKRLGEIVDEE